VACAFAFERPGHAHLVDPDADFRRHALVDPEIVERLAHVEIGLAGRDDAEARTRTVEHDLVEPVCAREGKRRIGLVAVEAVFLDVPVVRPADVEPARRHLEIVGGDDRHAMRIDMDGGRCVHRVGDALHRDPAARI